jgi:hypothetical protein
LTWIQNFYQNLLAVKYQFWSICDFRGAISRTASDEPTLKLPKPYSTWSIYPTSEIKSETIFEFSPPVRVCDKNYENFFGQFIFVFRKEKI